jgi:hypothetical protein
MQVERVHTATCEHTFDVTFSGIPVFDKVHAGALCAALRDNPRVLLAAHVSDHTTLRIRIVMVSEAGTTKAVASAIQAAANTVEETLRAMFMAAVWTRDDSMLPA